MFFAKLLDFSETDMIFALIFLANNEFRDIRENI